MSSSLEGLLTARVVFASLPRGELVSSPGHSLL